jgi:hypothetical protein
VWSVHCEPSHQRVTPLLSGYQPAGGFSDMGVPLRDVDVCTIGRDHPGWPLSFDRRPVHPSPPTRGELFVFWRHPATPGYGTRQCHRRHRCSEQPRQKVLRRSLLRFRSLRALAQLQRFSGWL